MCCPAFNSLPLVSTRLHLVILTALQEQVLINEQHLINTSNALIELQKSIKSVTIHVL